MICTNCGYNNIDEAKFCTLCGEKLAVPVSDTLCRRCSRSVDPNDIYCEYCGCRLYPYDNLGEEKCEEVKKQNTDRIFEKRYIQVSPLLSCYVGDRIFGNPFNTGYLLLYDDMLAFSAGLNQPNNGINITQTFRFEDIERIERGRARIMVSILLTLKSGEKYSYSSVDSRVLMFMNRANRVITEYNSIKKDK